MYDDILIVYSSRTGNTEKVARSIAAALPGSRLYSVEEAPAPSEDSLCITGTWVYRGDADPKMRRYLEEMPPCHAAWFATLGAWPDSAHAGKVRRAMAARINGTPLGSFLCQGRVDASLYSGRREAAHRKHHPMTPEREARLREAARHPDTEDLRLAGDFARCVARRFLLIKGEAAGLPEVGSQFQGVTVPCEYSPFFKAGHQAAEGFGNGADGRGDLLA